MSLIFLLNKIFTHQIMNYHDKYMFAFINKKKKCIVYILQKVDYDFLFMKHGFDLLYQTP